MPRERMDAQVRFDCRARDKRRWESAAEAAELPLALWARKRLNEAAEKELGKGNGRSKRE